MEVVDAPNSPPLDDAVVDVPNSPPLEVKVVDAPNSPPVDDVEVVDVPNSPPVDAVAVVGVPKSPPLDAAEVDFATPKGLAVDVDDDAPKRLLPDAGLVVTAPKGPPVFVVPNNPPAAVVDVAVVPNIPLDADVVDVTDGDTPKENPPPVDFFDIPNKLLGADVVAVIVVNEPVEVDATVVKVVVVPACWSVAVKNFGAPNKPPFVFDGVASDVELAVDEDLCIPKRPPDVDVVEDTPSEEFGAPNKPPDVVALVLVEDFGIPKKPPCAELDVFNPNKLPGVDVVVADIDSALVEDPKSPTDGEDFGTVEDFGSFTKPNGLDDEPFVELGSDAKAD